MKKIIFSVALLNISLIFSAPARPEGQITKKVRHLTNEEHTEVFNKQIKCNYRLIDEIIADNKKNKKEIKEDPKDKEDFEFITKTDSECRTAKISLDHKCFPIFNRIFHKYFLTPENVHKYFLTPENAHKRC